MRSPVSSIVFATLILLGISAGAAHAVTLEVADDAPGWAHVGAALLLYLHIGGGAIGLATGTIALTARKGGALHRAAGRGFVGAMFVAYLIGALVAPFLQEGQRPNFVAGVLALYLLVTGVLAARNRSAPQTNRGRWVGLAVSLAIATLGAAFMWMGMSDPEGTVDGSPPQAFVLFIVAGTIAALGEVNAIRRRQLPPSSRVTRHLWRMCFSFFIASGSLFLGQPQVFPDSFNASPLPLLLAFLPLAVLVLWLLRVRLGYLRS